MWKRNPGATQLDPPFQRIAQGCNLGVSQGCSPLKAQLGEDLLLGTLPWLLQDSVPHTEQLLLSLGGCPPFLATGLLIKWQLVSPKWVSEVSQRKSISEREDIVFQTISLYSLY